MSNLKKRLEEEITELQQEEIPDYSPLRWQLLEDYLTPERRARIEEVLSQRTRHFTLVLEDLYHAQNVSAAIRSAECFGVQDVHFIKEHYGDVRMNKKIVRGSTKWVNLREHQKSEACIQELRAAGYRIVATSPHATTSITELDVSQKTAVVFGKEKEGIKEETLKAADDFVKIPMYGFTESFNISVSAALCMSHFMERLRRSEAVHWQLSEEEKAELRYQWTFLSVRNAPRLLAQLEKRYAEGRL